jgi:hypothetical protein
MSGLDLHTGLSDREAAERLRRGGLQRTSAIVLYVPSIRDLFQFSTLHLNDIAVCMALAIASITGIEAAKLIRRHI